jgi:hypothetical protein
VGSRRSRVAIIGHVVRAADTVMPTPMERWGYTFNRVTLPDGSMMDHLAYLKGKLGLGPYEDFTVWDMYLAGPLVLKSYLEAAGTDVLLINHIDTQDYNLWEIAVLESKGFDRRQILEYRAMINEMTATQIRAARGN